MTRCFCMACLGFALLACAGGRTGSDAGPRSDDDGGGSTDGGSTDGGSPTTDAGGPASWSAACASYASTYCDRLEACSHLALVRQFGVIETCRTRSALGCVGEHDAPSVSATTAQLATCGSAWASASCGDFLAGVRPEDCRIPGTVADGGSCAVDAQCQSLRCRIRSVDGAGCGTCVAPIPIGGRCDYFAPACADGAICPFSAGGMTSCVRADGLSGLGETCGLSSDCEPHLFCHGTTCASAVALGGACSTPGLECDIGAGLWCVSETCVSVHLPSLGESCAPDGSDVPTYCVGGGSCQSSTGNTCVAAFPEGHACADDSRCLAPARCFEGTCQIASAAACAP